MKRVIIGIGGPKTGGKGEAARVLVNEFGFRVISFAEPIKQMLITLGVPPRYLREEKEVPIPEFDGRTGRHMMQTLGTEWGRNLIYPNIWLNLFAREVERVTKNMIDDDFPPRIVCDDVRFANESDAIKAIGGVVWAVLGRVQFDREHPSEAGEFEPDSVIWNRGTQADLRAEVVAHANRVIHG